MAAQTQTESVNQAALAKNYVEVVDARKNGAYRHPSLA